MAMFEKKYAVETMYELCEHDTSTIHWICLQDKNYIKAGESTLQKSNSLYFIQICRIKLQNVLTQHRLSCNLFNFNDEVSSYLQCRYGNHLE